MRSLLRGKRSFCQHGRSLPSPQEIYAFYSRLNHAYMHPLTCVKYGAAALTLGPAHGVTVPRGAASEYRICVSIIISAYGVYYLMYRSPPLVLHYMYCLIASRGGNVLCTLSLWACAYMFGWAYKTISCLQLLKFIIA